VVEVEGVEDDFPLVEEVVVEVADHYLLKTYQEGEEGEVVIQLPQGEEEVVEVQLPLEFIIAEELCLEMATVAKQRD
jgi:hypothetical protein